ncbi:unnamed protein product [Rodentolepis nana]|uniref:Aldehyde dehydrogenase domain-containing protein n=1 Tax=Rodentolepis nana TaxID=102285 RepID=A0A3P7RT10_RODNA|nr:unnamed protein product [Rodentolepis nana]
MIIGSWSSPFQSLMIPFAGAIAAGNCVVIKPNELSTETGELLYEQIPKYLDRSICQVLSCTLDETREFIDENKMDFIFFSGVSSDGAFIMSEAAKTITPVCLDLSGKWYNIPAYIDDSADVELSAKRIMWGKIYNCGQSSLAPDYALCHLDIQARPHCLGFYNELPNVDTDDYGRIVSQAHTQRLKELMLETRGILEFGGVTSVQRRFVQPTVISNVLETDALMQHEIYGPVLPVISVKSSSDALEYVRNLPKPQAVYIFAKEKAIFDVWKKCTSSGGIILNDVVMFKGPNGMNFGGVDSSGMGQYRGKASFQLFSHQRGVVERSTNEKLDKRYGCKYFTKFFGVN